MDNTLPVINILRHRLTSDGRGVITLVGSCGCPLRCQYCINEGVIRNQKKAVAYTPEMLFEAVKIDDLYFQSTGGGITFGGGEALLYADFIHTFRRLAPPVWHINVETSLNIEESNLKKVLDDIDEYIVDIKDMNAEIYKKYTGKSQELMLQNLKLLIKCGKKEQLHIRIPHIPGYNTESGVQSSVERLHRMGITKTEVFPYIIRK